MHADSTESAPPIDLPLHDEEPAVTEEPAGSENPPLGQETSSARPGGRGTSQRRAGPGVAVGMLVIGLLAGFGAGFVLGQRLAPPAPPRAVEVPRPERGPGIGDRRSELLGPGLEGSAAEPRLPAPVEPVPVGTVAPDPAPTAAVLDAVPAPRTPNPEPRTSTPGSPIPDPQSPIPAARPATLQFDSRPSGATVYVDGGRVGVTPMTLAEVRPGVHTVRFELAGHRPWATAVTVEAGVQGRVGASLEPQREP